MVIVFSFQSVLFHLLGDVVNDYGYVWYHLVPMFDLVGDSDVNSMVIELEKTACSVRCSFDAYLVISVDKDSCLLMLVLDRCDCYQVWCEH